MIAVLWNDNVQQNAGARKTHRSARLERVIGHAFKHLILQLSKSATNELKKRFEHSVLKRKLVNPSVVYPVVSSVVLQQPELWLSVPN